MQITLVAEGTVGTTLGGGWGAYDPRHFLRLTGMGRIPDIRELRLLDHLMPDREPTWSDRDHWHGGGAAGWSEELTVEQAVALLREHYPTGQQRVYPWTTGWQGYMVGDLILYLETGVVVRRAACATP